MILVVPQESVLSPFFLTRKTRVMDKVTGQTEVAEKHCYFSLKVKVLSSIFLYLKGVSCLLSF